MTDFVTPTQADREAAADYIASFKTDPTAPSKTVQNTRDGKANSVLVQAFARHRQSHSLPGDVKMLRSAIEQALKCTPSIKIIGSSKGVTQHRIVYDGGDPWEILRAALAHPAQTTPSAVSGDAGEGE